MTKVVTVLTALIVLALAPHSLAQCECEMGPCEELTLQSVAARDPERAGFGTEMPATAIIPARRSSGMEINLSSVDRDRSSGFAALLLVATIFLPVISLVRRWIGSTGPLAVLNLTQGATVPPETVTRSPRPCAPVGSIETRIRRTGAEPAPEPA